LASTIFPEAKIYAINTMVYIGYPNRNVMHDRVQRLLFARRGDQKTRCVDRPGILDFIKTRHPKSNRLAANAVIRVGIDAFGKYRTGRSRRWAILIWLRPVASETIRAPLVD